MNKQKEEKMRKLYYDPEKGLYNASKLYQKVKDIGVTLEQVKQFVERQKIGQQFRPPKKKEFYPITAPTQSYQADLIFFPKHKRINLGYNTALTIIEITSRMGYCFPMKGKKIDEVKRVMKLFLEKEEVDIVNLTTDKGSEFISKSFQKLMKKHGVSHV
eukprot:CAMPEP_0201547518 /NCGR_PEP_ID=MMETSP0173_2-20130828/3987_1 /ASSEMBLY_ACC=CAM_ASM_000268 /TAXON_ID=218659 /ORGANISM="Vexillifera sp., Strain DIVA3 564/2" /LENGTH=158 /DNA_ID=CAMNT_0047956587 /DNA_START=919 /DNA_END=1392 /DNA_ORIENTATION=+